MNHFRNLPEAAALAAANKRVANILAKEVIPEGKVTDDYLIEDAEKALFEEFWRINTIVKPLFDTKDYTAALSELAVLSVPIDAFFDNVMVMVDDANLKTNRLRMLQLFRNLFMQVADISVLQH